MINCILARSDNNVIGKNNKLPWNLPDDLRKFGEFTLNKTVVMGRKTFESLGRPLPNRKNYIISKTLDKVEGCFVYNSVRDFLLDTYDEEVWAIGGAEIYKLFFTFADNLYITQVYGEFDGDTFCPKFDDFFEKKEIVHIHDKFEIQRWEYKFYE